MRETDKLVAYQMASSGTGIAEIARKLGVGVHDDDLAVIFATARHEAGIKSRPPTGPLHYPGVSRGRKRR